jgi:hypothetical protein
MKGKLISFVPKIVNGAQETYTGQNGVLYKFVVTFETDGNNVIGTANSSKQQPSWKVGEEYTYEETRNTSSTGTVYITFKNIKNLNAAPFGQKKSDPTFVVQKAFECAVECSITFWDINIDTFTSDALDAMISTCFERIMKFEKENEKWAYISALRLATFKYKCLGPASSIEGKHSTWLFKSADAIANAMLSVCKTALENSNGQSSN